jgi:hypothetical protein
MKSILIILIPFFMNLPSSWQQHNIDLIGSAIPKQLPVKRAGGDTSGSIHIINGSSLKRLPNIIRDLSLALRESPFHEGLLLDEIGFSVYLYDVTCKSAECSAAVMYETGDTVYDLKFNRLNRMATDEALATTLIHEIMHCVLLDISKRIKNDDEQTFANIISFGLNKNIDPSFSNYDFFLMMNSGNDGHHELMYRFFFPHMVSLLKSFSKIHKQGFFDPADAEILMWSGLQKTSGYKELNDDEKINIEWTILEAKGINNRR